MSQIRPCSNCCFLENTRFSVGSLLPNNPFVHVHWIAPRSAILTMVVVQDQPERIPHPLNFNCWHPTSQIFKKEKETFVITLAKRCPALEVP